MIMEHMATTHCQSALADPTTATCGTLTDIRNRSFEMIVLF